MIAPPPGLRIEPSYATNADEPLWLPRGLRPRNPGERIIVPPDLKKIIYYKGRPYGAGFDFGPGQGWVGKATRVPYDFDIDEPGHDGVSLRDHIHLWITGKLEQVYGIYVHQDTDERYHTTGIEAHPAGLHSQERWDRFLRRDP